MLIVENLDGNDCLCHLCTMGFIVVLEEDVYWFFFLLFVALKKTINWFICVLISNQL